MNSKYISKKDQCNNAIRAIESYKITGKLNLSDGLRNHTDSCGSCWTELVSARWGKAKNTRDIIELREYLGSDFQWGCDSSWKLAHEWNDKDRQSQFTDEEFYRGTQWYIYNLLIWEASGQRPNYVENASSILSDFNIKTILDFGAGVGNDALKFAEQGYGVHTVEINKVCVDFLEWRIEKRKIENMTVLQDGQDYDVVWAMDVIEHLREPVDVLAPFLKKARLLIYDWEDNQNSSGRHPFHFQHDEVELRAKWAELGFLFHSDEGGFKIYKRKV